MNARPPVDDAEPVGTVDAEPCEQVVEELFTEEIAGANREGRLVREAFLTHVRSAWRAGETSKKAAECALIGIESAMDHEDLQSIIEENFQEYEQLQREELGDSR